MKALRKEIVVPVLALAAIAASAASIWRTQFNRTTVNLPLHQGIGQRAAEETARALNEKGGLVIVTLEPGASDVVDAQLAAFKAALARWPGLEIIRQDEVDSSKGAKYGPGTGMSARRFQKLQGKYPTAEAIVSFIGAPDPEDLKDEKGAGGPVLIAISRAHGELEPLLDKGTLVCAIVPRFAFPAPGPENPSTPAEWFENRCQVLAAN